MKINIPMPKMGESVTEGTIIKWHKKPGDTVKKDEIIFEISTDKVDTEIPSPDAGVIIEILRNEGDTVPVGEFVAVLATAGEIAVEAPEHVSVNLPVTNTAPAENIPHVSVPVTTEKAEQGSLIDVVMPKMGESVMEGTVIKWHKKIGDKIKKEETIFEVSTDKVDTEVPSHTAGVLAEILVQEQETVPVGAVVCRINSSDSIPATANQVVETAVKEVSMHDIIGKQTTISEPVHAVKTAIESDKFYSPLVLSIAEKEGVTFKELNTITGTGLEGRVSKKDILDYVKRRGSSPALHAPKPAPEPVRQTAAPVQQYQPPVEQKIQQNYTAPAPVYFSDGSTEVIPMDNIRKKIMSHMINSRDTSVHVTEVSEVDMSNVSKFLSVNKDRILSEQGVKLTYMAFISHAVIKSLKQYPLVNSSIDGSSIIQKKYVNLGIAVSLDPNGLIVPNIKNAQDLNLTGLARSVNDLALRARNKKLSPDEISGGTFSITNYGVFGTLLGTPIINQPEVAILGVGAVVKRPVVVEINGTDLIAIKPMMYLTLAHDHRLVDGMLGGLFLKTVKEHLENFDFNSAL
ncbi:MAG: 2-oxoglutarate dehydrogenase, E2 component, dihydrolipoamide succinyltransferase [Ignavibacteriaceae bacterium]|nr:2-oxoglutarate dehydrogenase, E2 component, dihydrolipoamide succinyltransferase [Ignavibacteriaceae bacterium]